MRPATVKAPESAMSQQEKFELLESEVLSFYEYCREAGMSEEDLEVICRPLTHAVRRAAVRRRTRAVLMLMAAAALVYTAYGSEWLAWKVSALIRLGMIRILPVWDWTKLYDQPCLIPGFRTVETMPNADILQFSDCTSCEAIQKISRVSATDYEALYGEHLSRGAPVVVADAHAAWTPAEALNLTALLQRDARLSDSVPCRLLSNIRLGRQPVDLHDIVSRITGTKPNWFVHFQNCDIKAVKSLRVLAPRPYFLAPHIRPAHFSWLLLSNKYQSHRYKYLELDVGLIVMSQLKGANRVSLKPRAPCDEECARLDLELAQGDTLVFGNALWELEYSPDPSGENIAMLTETDWDEV